MRRRAHAPSRQASSTDMGLYRRAREVPPLHRPARRRPRRDPRAQRGPTTRCPRPRLRGEAAATSTRSCSSARRRRRRDLTRAPRPSPPIVEGGLVTGRRRQGQGAPARPARSRPATSSSPTAPTRRFGRALGTARNRSYPLGMAIRDVLREPAPRRAVDRVWPRRARPQRQPRCRATAGSSRWATAPSTSASACSPRSATSTTSTPPPRCASGRPPRRTYWKIDRPTRSCARHRRPPADGRLGQPEGRSHLGRSWATPGSVNPFNGEGIDYAYETGRQGGGARSPRPWPAAAAPRRCHRTPSGSRTEYGLYFKVARLFAQVIGRPALMRELAARSACQSRTPHGVGAARSWRNLLRPDEVGPAEAASKAAAGHRAPVPRRLTTPPFPSRRLPAQTFRSCPSTSPVSACPEPLWSGRVQPVAPGVLGAWDLSCAPCRTGGRTTRRGGPAISRRWA